MAALRRRFLKVGDRRVHYLRAGEGPPAVLVHSSPANAWLLLPEIERLSRAFTVFAFDTPGFGLSQPLPMAEMQVADLADALAETLGAIGMPPCPMFGSHSGAAIALEFGARHPGRVTGLVLDGVPSFTPQECEALFGDYFRPLPTSDLGAQYAMAWTRFRDQSVWFPWSQRRPETLNAYDLAPPESTHLWVSMYFEAADTYTPAYRACSYYGAGAIAAAQALETPAIFTATETDMLFAHMARLPPMKPGQEIRHIGRSYPAKRDLIAEGFARFGSPGRAPEDPDEIGSSPTLERQFVDVGRGRQLHLRHVGDRRNPALVLLHDAPGSAAALEPLIEALGRAYFVIAPDLPGSGESEAFADGHASLSHYAGAVTDLLDGLGLRTALVYGVGFGSSLAIELARASHERFTGLILHGVLAPDEDERAGLKAAYTPPITIEPDGAHWYRTWLMLRDSLIWWPWYDRRQSAQRKAAVDFDADRLHRWTVDVMRRRDSYGDLIQAALDHDALAALRGLRVPVLRVTGPQTPLQVFDARIAGRLPQGAVVERGADLRAHASAVAAHFSALSSSSPARAQAAKARSS